LDPAIRYVAIIDSSNTIIECKGQGAPSLPLSIEKLVDFASIGPLLIMATIGNKLESSCGRLGYAIASFENALVIIYQLHNLMVVIVTDPTMQIQQIRQIGNSLAKMEEDIHSST
jgi:hypothetical protein